MLKVRLKPDSDRKAELELKGSHLISRSATASRAPQGIAIPVEITLRLRLLSDDGRGV